MCIRFLALIVVYGLDPVKTSSLQTLLANVFDRERLRILVWDNSPIPTFDADNLQQTGIVYRSTPENIGLSRIYNYVIANELRDGEYLLLLDQDTVLPVSFLTIVNDAIKQHSDIDLFLPMIKVNSNWVSPQNYYLGWGRYWKNPRIGRMKSAHIFAINSGMVISSRYLLGRRVYDEHLSFYGTDTQFMLDYAERRHELVVLNVNLNHDLSFFSESIENRAKKFAVMKAANKHIYSSRSLFKRFGSFVIISIISFIYAWRYRSIKFLSPRS